MSYTPIFMAPAFQQNKSPISIRPLILLLTLVVAVFAQVISFDFVNYDDDNYVYKHPIVKQGITMEGMHYAALACNIDCWHPAVWISHMLDCQLFGLNAGGHHLTNALLHLFNVALLYWLILQFFNNPALAFCIAGLWGLHPLRVESVAWISERKDVLSGFFFLSILNLYVLQFKKPTTLKQLGCLFLFFLGLAAKNMLVSLPIILLLLDYWPLNRFSKESYLSLLKEKNPYVILSVFSVLTTMLALISIPEVYKLPTSIMLQNAFGVFSVYFYQLLLPIHLVTPYPDTPSFQPIQLVGSISFLVAVSFLCWRYRQQVPAITIGWFWFVIMSIPTAGFIQITNSPHFDRYTYLPSIGLTLGLVAAFIIFFSKYRKFLKPAIFLAICWAIGLVILCYQQLSYWKNGSSLWSHDIAVSDNNYIAFNNRGVLTAERGDIKGAEKDFWAAQHSKPIYADAYYNLGAVAYREGHISKAKFLASQALKLNPKLNTKGTYIEKLP